MGLSAAASVRVGNALGAGKPQQAKLSCKVPVACTRKNLHVTRWTKHTHSNAPVSRSTRTTLITAHPSIIHPSTVFCALPPELNLLIRCFSFLASHQCDSARRLFCHRQEPDRADLHLRAVSQSLLSSSCVSPRSSVMWRWCLQRKLQLGWLLCVSGTSWNGSLLSWSSFFSHISSMLLRYEFPPRPIQMSACNQDERANGCV